MHVMYVLEMLQRKTEEMSNSLPISDPTVTGIQALKTRAFHLRCSSLSLESDTGLPVTSCFCAPQVMGVPGVLALFSSQRKNPILVNVLIVASIISCVAILIVIGYSSFTLNYGEEEELSSAPVHVIHTRFILSKVVKGANIAMLAASICSAFFVLAMVYLGCRSLPRCSCYDSVTGMEWLQPTEDQNQAVEMVCAVQSPGDRISNFPDRFPAQDVDAEEDTSKPPPYIRLT
ncbi:uncharacterized protein LOC126642680 isoform X1 [Myiozetetes cayanensis]|uniref:uncharacterized protein LOC126642680 isoform X1 n=1 Tax=Myiozetetes cayanensis TaxID=478635 RepID=UPI00215DECA0|nr:uncharacterized protein LOC126642680 isoform X1 [Myiozetetes cayanensis]